MTIQGEYTHTTTDMINQKKNKHAHRNKPNKDSAKPGAWTKCTDFGEAYYAFLETFTESQMLDIRKRKENYTISW